MSKGEGSTEKKFTSRNLPLFEALASGHRACQGCGEVLALRLAMKAVGKDVIVVNATGCMEVITTPFPETAWKVPWIHVAFENAAAVGSGIDAARKAIARKGRISEDKAKIVIVGGDGGTSDIGFQALSGALERWHDFTYICLDNEGYMNTGIQRSSATPWGSWTTTTPVGGGSCGKRVIKKDLPSIVAAHHIPYVATASPSSHLDLMNKVRKGVMMQGPAFIHVLCPCPTGWKIPTHLTVTVAKMAVETTVYPLYEVVNGQYFVTRKIATPKPVSEYLKMQGRFKHLTKTQISSIQSEVEQKYSYIQWLASRKSEETTRSQAK
jgi:pyruvate ferredoxin oxidoreductase beta subunit